MPGASEAYRSYALHHDVAVTAEALQSAGVSLAQAYIYADALVSDSMSLPLTDLQKSNLASLRTDPVAQATWSRLHPTPAEPIAATQTASPPASASADASIGMAKEGTAKQKLHTPASSFTVRVFDPSPMQIPPSSEQNSNHEAISSKKERVRQKNAVANSNIGGTMKQTGCRKFNGGTEVNDFFYNDGERKGLRQIRNSQYRKWCSGLSQTAKDSLFDYTANGYRIVNDWLRKKYGFAQNGEIESQIKAIDEAISTFNLRENILVQRGAPYSSLVMLFENNNITTLKDLIGKKYKDDAYISTTALYGNPIATTKNVVFDMSIPAGVGRGAYINEFSTQYRDAEYEFLIKRGATFTITEVTENTDLDKIYIKMNMDE